MQKADYIKIILLTIILALIGILGAGAFEELEKEREQSSEQNRIAISTDFEEKEKEYVIVKTIEYKYIYVTEEEETETETEIEYKETTEYTTETFIEENTEATVTTEAPAAEQDMTYYSNMELTAYVWTGNPCADSVYPEVGYTAACNDPYLWHKWVYIEGIGKRYIHDTGGMASNVIDIYVGDYDSAVQFGRQGAAVYVLE